MLFDSLFMDTIYPLNKWLTVVLFIFLGFLFILVWIMGEYIGRIYNEEVGRPLYIINDKINFEPQFNEKSQELKIISSQ
jgi:Na+-transporting methylmalonyl-CoA/oxaloacetate decarboxylase gamma subunit